MSSRSAKSSELPITLMTRRNIVETIYESILLSQIQGKLDEDTANYIMARHFLRIITAYSLTNPYIFERFKDYLKKSFIRYYGHILLFPKIERDDIWGALMDFFYEKREEILGRSYIRAEPSEIRRKLVPHVVRLVLESALAVFYELGWLKID